MSDAARRSETESNGVGGLITRQSQPRNLESPFWALSGPITPNHRFYVRSHFPEVPALDPATWTLTVEGAVERPCAIGYDELTAMPSRDVTATLECAGNGRVFLKPPAKGVQWERGAVSTAVWTGVPLRDLLERAGVRPGAVEVVLEGADRGKLSEEPKSPGEISFARSLPLERATAREADVLLAWRMNGETLTPAHGFPLRAVVPGWYAMASVKWLTRLAVVDRPFAGFFQTVDYSYWERGGGEDGLPPQMRPITDLDVKAQIARPAPGESLPRGTEFRVFGAAGGGGGAPVEKVEVSADGGQTWREARLLGEATPNAWRLWEFPWRTPDEPGAHSLVARATDARGNAQPAEHDPGRCGYRVNFPVPVEFDVY